jgi:hypothetical protein
MLPKPKSINKRRSVENSRDKAEIESTEIYISIEQKRNKLKGSIDSMKMFRGGQTHRRPLERRSPLLLLKIKVCCILQIRFYRLAGWLATHAAANLRGELAVRLCARVAVQPSAQLSVKLAAHRHLSRCEIRQTERLLTLLSRLDYTERSPNLGCQRKGPQEIRGNVRNSTKSVRSCSSTAGIRFP